MSGKSTAGADWKGVGELKALRRIVGGNSEEDEDVPAPVGHNRPPQSAVHETTGPEIALEEQAQVVERVLAETEGMQERVGKELLRLRDRFCSVELGRRAHILRLEAEGLLKREIAVQLGISTDTVYYHIRSTRQGKDQKGVEPAAMARFMTWATARFKRSRGQLRQYLFYGKDPSRRAKQRSKNAAHAKKMAPLLKLARASLHEKVAPPLFKQAFLALGDRGAAPRTAVACWIISLEAGSDDPQEIARWFAAH